MAHRRECTVLDPPHTPPPAPAAAAAAPPANISLSGPQLCLSVFNIIKGFRCDGGNPVSFFGKYGFSLCAVQQAGACQWLETLGNPRKPSEPPSLCPRKPSLAPSALHKYEAKSVMDKRTNHKRVWIPPAVLTLNVLFRPCQRHHSSADTQISNVRLISHPSESDGCELFPYIGPAEEGGVRGPIWKAVVSTMVVLPQVRGPRTAAQTPGHHPYPVLNF